MKECIIVDKAQKTNIDPFIVRDYMESLIYHTKLKRLLNKRSFKEVETILHNAYADIDIMKENEKIIYEILKDNAKANQFLNDRRDITNLQENCSELPSINDFYALPLTDRVHITLLAHTMYTYIVFDEEIFDMLLRRIDLSNPALIDWDWGSKPPKDVKQLVWKLKKFLHKLLGQEGLFFYGIKIKKTDIKAEYIKHFIIELYKKRRHIEIFTDFCAVFLYSGKSKYIILNNTLESETKENTLKLETKEIKKDIIKVVVDAFVVRCNVFHCMHESHKIKDIIALIDIIDDNGKKCVEKVPAGYCTECNLFFILESTFENLKKKGILLCKVTDIKSVNKFFHINGEKLAHESLLMQYGYSVSQINNLSEERRKKILAVIIDNEILSKIEIISYLDLFINQRLSISNMETAITKWTEDRDFVQNYKMGAYAQFGVSALYRK